MEKTDVLVIGAGVIGLAVARALAHRGREVVVVEAAAGIGTGTSSRNSEVIHSGIYYEADSLKARLCVQGRAALLAYCDARHVPYRLCGKLIVATSTAELGLLQMLHARALGNGVGDLYALSSEAVRQLEPDIDCLGALLSPGTGILDSHAFMLALQADAQAAGAMFAFHSPVVRGTVDAAATTLEIGGASPMRLAARCVINCAGLEAQAVAASLHGLAAQHVPKTYYAKGNYFAVTGAPRFQHLVYPMPESAGLGVHLTIDLGGQTRFGPDVEWLPEGAACDYAVDPNRARDFYAAIRRYWPGLPDAALQADYAGIRPKLAGPGMPASDFRIDGPGVHGIAGLVNLFGIESPGLTASLAIGDLVASLLTQAAGVGKVSPSPS